ncbi:MAG TPA: hypothetical protein PKA64_11115 [Myxococcota bacterium]|nr:hypothetical protein [Myxococcota bacterium]
MSYTTLYRIDSDGNLSAVAEIRNSHGGQPLVWDLLEDEFDPPSPDWLRRYSFLARDGKISGRWMFDSGDPQAGIRRALDHLGSAREEDSLDRREQYRAEAERELERVL